jgi:hypothetical protein
MYAYFGFEFERVFIERKPIRTSTISIRLVSSQSALHYFSYTKKNTLDMYFSITSTVSALVLLVSSVQAAHTLTLKVSASTYIGTTNYLSSIVSIQICRTIAHGK